MYLFISCLDLLERKRFVSFDVTKCLGLVNVSSRLDLCPQMSRSRDFGMNVSSRLDLCQQMSRSRLVSTTFGVTSCLVSTCFFKGLVSVSGPQRLVHIPELQTYVSSSSSLPSLVFACFRLSSAKFPFNISFNS
jgi:hypothetical protein